MVLIKNHFRFIEILTISAKMNQGIMTLYYLGNLGYGVLLVIMPVSQ